MAIFIQREYEACRHSARVQISTRIGRRNRACEISKTNYGSKSGNDLKEQHEHTETPEPRIQCGGGS